ncbi:MAG: TetR/AcrR family transcriptional regulator; helix-turn-helix transcriptional regulator [Dysgonamonadaceae bacterium]|jgi:AcrR family transcriptional regulator|nr:TetR/AcrR family transcriptional regulator; helix-turn-helix transcriptional regulator [Dysgonamonadaceae bacterium]
MAIAKTKLTLIEVARQLFARNGIENTTMNDIAEASKKGRRTLYTYFRSKHDIYSAVVETELNNLYLQLEGVLKRDMSADDKLMLFLFTRLNAIKNVVNRNGTLRANFFRNIWRVENVRRGFDLKEISYLQTIMEEGVKSGVFEITDIPQTARLLHYTLKGLEVPTIRGVFDLNVNNREDRELIGSLIFKGIKKNKH